MKLPAAAFWLLLLCSVTCAQKYEGVADCATDVCLVQDLPIKPSMFSTRKIASKFIAREERVGVGAIIRRSVGSQELGSLDPFLLLDEFSIGYPGGFPPHPHRGFEAVSYILPTSKGHMRHQDFMGKKGELHPGNIQWLTAGRGIVHVETPVSAEAAHGLQLWVNLPKARKMVEPRYQEVSRATFLFASDQANGVEAIVIAGEALGAKGPIEHDVPLSYVHFTLKKGGKLKHAIPTDHNSFVYILTGTGLVAGEKVVPHEACILEAEGDGIEISTEDEEGLEFVVFSGQPLNEPVVQHGPFVMTSRSEISATIQDYQGAKNGFENAHTWMPDSITPKQ